MRCAATPNALDPEGLADVKGFRRGVAGVAAHAAGRRRLGVHVGSRHSRVTGHGGPSGAVLVATDAAALAGLHPSIGWLHLTWGGPAGLAASGRAWAAFDGADVVSVAATFFVGARHEEIGVVTDPAHRGRGLSTACTAALVRDIRARGRRPSWTTSPDNTASLGVAARLGFAHVRDDVLYAVRTEIPT